MYKTEVLLFLTDSSLHFISFLPLSPFPPSKIIIINYKFSQFKKIQPNCLTFIYVGENIYMDNFVCGFKNVSNWPVFKCWLCSYFQLPSPGGGGDDGDDSSSRVLATHVGELD